MTIKIYLAGSTGLVGSAVLNRLKELGHKNIITRTRAELDLTNQNEVYDFFSKERPTHTILAAAKVGGIIANSLYQADFIRKNLLIQTNVIDAAKIYGCKKFCFLGSSCIYPKLCQQPIKEEYLLTGELEETNAAYATAKIAGIQMINSYRKQYGLNGYYSLMPTNLFGERDNFNLETSHVLPALIRKFHEAKINGSDFVIIYGTGSAYREFLFSEDIGKIICSTLFMGDVPKLMNVGAGKDITIANLATLIKDIVGFSGEIRYDGSKPDGTPRKLLDVSKMEKLGLKADTSLEDGIRKTYKWYMKNCNSI